jgi:hypothetical protein
VSYRYTGTAPVEIAGRRIMPGDILAKLGPPNGADLTPEAVVSLTEGSGEAEGYAGAIPLEEVEE